MAANGELQNTQAGANIRTTRDFGDFKLHIEYNCPPGGNSGVYLRGRYEVQVEYEPAGKNDSFHSMGSIYGFIPPATTLDPRPGPVGILRRDARGPHRHRGSGRCAHNRQRGNSGHYRRCVR